MHLIKYTSVLILLVLGCIHTSFAQKGYEIIIELENFKEKEAYLANYYGNNPYIKDTVKVNDAGQIIFSGEEELEGGIYLGVLPPNNQFVQFFISKGEQHFTIKADVENLSSSVVIKGSPDNTLFYNYMSFLGNQLKKKEAIEARMKEAEGDENAIKKIEEEYISLDKEVKAYHENIIKNHPKTLTAAFIANRVEIELPEFEGTEGEIKKKQWLYVKDHYFDLLDMTDDRLSRAPFLYDRVDYFMTKLTVQHPDSLPVSIDHVLKLVRPSEVNFKYYLVHFLNTFAKSKIVGMDAVYVHIVDNYYAKGLAPWTEEKQLKKIIKNANTLRPILIGKTAPNIEVEKEDASKIKLHDVDSEVTIMFFWAPDCGHCKKSMPQMVEFYDKYKDKGVEIFGICTMVQDKCKDCWKAIEERNMGKWINTTDPFLKSRYKQIYDIRTTPQIFVLDKDKKIISKRIGAEQLEEVIEEYFKYKDTDRGEG